MDRGTGIVLGVSVLLVVGLLALRASSKRRPIMGTIGGQGYLPGKSTTVMTGITTIGSVLNHGIDLFISRDSNATKTEVARMSNTGGDTDSFGQSTDDASDTSDGSSSFFDDMMMH
jgi:hypothetical protein